MSEQVTELSTREQKKIVALLTDNFSVDKESFREDIAEALDIDVDELPTVDVQVVLSFGKQSIKASGFETEEKESSDDDSDF